MSAKESSKDNQGEGNREADKKYREGVHDTIESGTVEEKLSERRNTSADKQKELDKAAEATKNKT